MKLNKDTYKGDWAFTQNNVTIGCHDIYYIYVEYNNVKYALNGISQQKYKPLDDSLWLPDPNIKGIKVNIGPFMELASSLCK